MSLPKVGFKPRKVPTRVKDGGTGASTVPEVREKLGVPSLDGDNSFTGDVTFSGQVVVDDTVGGGLVVSGAASFTGGITDDSSDAAVFNHGLQTNGFAADLNGGLRLAYVSKTADYSVEQDTDCVVDVTSSSPTITLPDATQVGMLFIIKNSGAGTVTLATTSGQTIDGAAPGTIAAGNSLTLVSTGANWISV